MSKLNNWFIQTNFIGELFHYVENNLDIDFSDGEGYGDGRGDGRGDVNDEQDGTGFGGGVSFGLVRAHVNGLEYGYGVISSSGLINGRDTNNK